MMDYYNHTVSVKNTSGYDLHQNLNPYFVANGVYSTDLFTNKAEKIILSHDISRPMFMYMAQQAVHTPVEAPADVVRRFSNIKDPNRRTFLGR